jgi:GDP-4-dehydro-6-deoxy-D-mannose reductase
VTTALITGGRGFVGTHLCALLESEGLTVTTTDREVDVTRHDHVTAALSDVQPDVIFHLAALSHVGQSWAAPDETMRVNAEGTRVLLEAIGEVVPDATTVVVSSAEVYGTFDASWLPLEESAPLSPSTPYAQSKVVAEAIAREIASTGQRVLIARPFNHIGPGQNPQFFVPAMIERLTAAKAQGLTSIPVGNLTSRRDFTDVRDVVRAYVTIARHGISGEVYNVCSGQDHAMSDVAMMLRDLIAPSVTFVEDPELLRPSDIPVLRGSYRKLHEISDWSPTITLEASLRDAVAATR